MKMNTINKITQKKIKNKILDIQKKILTMFLNTLKIKICKKKVNIIKISLTFVASAILNASQMN